MNSSRLPPGSPDCHLRIKGRTVRWHWQEASHFCPSLLFPSLSPWHTHLGAWLQALQLLRLTEGFVVLKLVFNFVLGKEKLQPAFVAVINISLLKWRKAKQTRIT